MPIQQAANCIAVILYPINLQSKPNTLTDVQGIEITSFSHKGYLTRVEGESADPYREKKKIEQMIPATLSLAAL